MSEQSGETRAVQNEALFRQVNERIEALNESFGDLTAYGSWACECADTGCFERIDMTVAEYEALRAHPSWFAVFPSEPHVSSDVDEVVERTERYWIVKKKGAAGELAKNLDPRTA